MEGKPLIILVDELDRARPDYAVQFLEAIKHIFPVKGLFFVLAVDKEQLEASVKQLYGTIDFENYYRRFITREANLPVPETTDPKRFIEQQFEKYVGSNGERLHLFHIEEASQNEVVYNLGLASRALILRPREIEYLIRTFCHFISVMRDKIYGDMAWISASIFLIAISVHKNKDMYNRLGKGDVGPDELHKFIKAMPLSVKSEKNDVTEKLMAFILSNSDTAEIKQKIANTVWPRGTSGKTQQELNEETNETIQHLTHITNKGYGDKTAFQQIYDRLELWLPLIDA